VSVATVEEKVQTTWRALRRYSGGLFASQVVCARKVAITTVLFHATNHTPRYAGPSLAIVNRSQRGLCVIGFGCVPLFFCDVRVFHSVSQFISEV
jgi:hypothetical protein